VLARTWWFRIFVLGCAGNAEFWLLAAYLSCTLVHRFALGASSIKLPSGRCFAALGRSTSVGKATRRPPTWPPTASPCTSRSYSGSGIPTPPTGPDRVLDPPLGKTSLMTSIVGDKSPPAPRFCCIIPAKPLEFAKSRLGNLSRRHRRELAIAFLLDTLAAVTACEDVGSVIVVTNDLTLTRRCAALPVDVVDDGGLGLYVAISVGLTSAAARGAVHRVVMPGDLPALRSKDLSTALRSVGGRPLACVADWSGAGTTALIAQHVQRVPHQFGPNSFHKHQLAGAWPVEADTPTLRADVDTVRDLGRALDLGVGSHTAEVHQSYRPYFDAVARASGDIGT